MKKIFIVCILLVATSSVFAQPKIQINETSFNFGKCPQHAEVSHTFWLKSVGTENLVITEVVPGCGCTKAPLKDSVLAPGDSTSLEIIFSTKSYRGFVAKKPYIVTNISEEKIYLRIDAELVPEPETIGPVSFEPYKVDVSQFTEAPRRKAKFHLVNKSGRDYDIKLLDVSSKPFEVKLPNKIKAGETVEGMLTVNEDMVDSEFDSSITIEINDDFSSRISLPIKRIIRIIKK